jgi:hypothetical protein
MVMFTAKEKCLEAMREVKMRRRVYPRWIEEGHISQDVADRRIEIMQQIAEDYEKLAEDERLL